MIDTVRAITCTKCGFHEVYIETYEALPGV